MWSHAWIPLCAIHLPITVFVEPDHSVVFPYCIQLCTYFHWCKKDCIYWAFWRWGGAAHAVQRLANCKKGKGEEKRGKVGFGRSELCLLSFVCLCVCALKVGQSVPTLQLCVPAAASSSSCLSDRRRNWLPSRCVLIKILYATKRRWNSFSHILPQSTVQEESRTSKKNPSQGAPFNRASISSACLKKPLVCAFALRGHTAVQASRSSSGGFSAVYPERCQSRRLTTFFWEREPTRHS